MISKIKDYTDKLFYIASKFGIIAAYKLRIKPLLKHYIINHGKGDRLDLEFQALKDYLIPILSPIIQKYSTISESNSVIKEDDTIWVCWWQGEHQMPMLVKKCYELLKKHANKHPVNLITKDNFDQYIVLPTRILNLYKTKNISIQQLSDIMRMYLISHYGGIWIDATYWVTNDINIPFNFPFFSIKTGNSHDGFITRGKWSNNLLAGSKNSKFFCFIYDALIEYWNKNNYIIDYFLIDFISQIAYEKFPDIRYNIDNYTLTCPDMVNIDLNQYSDRAVIEKIMQNNAYIKLSWKKEYNIYKDNRLTIYGYFLNL